ncbi:MAG: DMT family transporter [Planctomycetia bacterium]|nr:DMT family transporter [Planctomycetia bacterium]
MVRDSVKGIFFGLLAAISYGMNPLFALPLYHEGFCPDAVLWYRYILAVVFLGTWLMWRHTEMKVGWQFAPLLTVNGLLMGCSSLFLFLSYQYMDAGVASTILFVYPVMVTGMMALFFHERVTLGTVLSIILAFTGVLALYWDENGATLDSVGVLMVILSALSYALYIVLVRVTRLRKLSAEVLTFYCLLPILPVFLMRTGWGAALTWPTSATAWWCVVLLALVPTILSLSWTALAIRYVGATPTAILGALEPATAVFFGITVFGEKLTIRLIFGLLFIIIAVLIQVAKTQKTATS